MDGDASNNDISNFGLNCGLCDKVRHCGLAGVKRELILRKSNLK